MANLFSGINARIRGAPPKPATTGPSKTPSPGPNEALAASEAPAASPYSEAQVPKGALPDSQPPSQSGAAGRDPYGFPRPIPLWLNPPYSKHIVKGNFMTLSARPKTVDQCEWVAHQVVEHYRNLWNFVRLVHEKEADGTSICNPSTCPKMSAGRNQSYTWLNRNRQPVELPAHEYISFMQRWISGKIEDINMFPTDASGVSYATHPEYANVSENWMGARGGFPKEFLGTCQLIFRQMFRVYAHLYWDHFTEPFYHLNLEKQLNSCFSHFILTATTLDMLQPKDLEPMQALIDLWAADGTFPTESKAYALANLERGKHLISLSNAA